MRNHTIIVSLLFVTAMATAQQASIRYTLGMSKPYTHLFEVGVTVERLPHSDKELDLIMPAWRSGRYMIFDFSGGVQEFSVVDENGRPLAWSKVDKETWRIQRGNASAVTARYLVYANEFGDRTRGLNDEHAFVDPATTFMFVKNRLNEPVALTVIPFGNWHVTTGLDHPDGKQNTFTAPNYEYFADCPIEIGNQNDFLFDVDGVPHDLMIAGKGNWDEKKMIPDLTKLVEANKEFWGRLPYKRYIFMLEVQPNAGGGTEHINSTIMQRGPFGFKGPDAYRSFLGLVSHEYFHTWNVKQLRPKGITPYDYTKEDYVRELWIAEGTTSYYGELMLLRLGFMTPQDFLNDIAKGAQGDRMRPGNRVQSVIESSFDAWVKYWRGRQNSYNAESDYYDKGSHVSLLLDLQIRQSSKNKHSLDDVMRTMFERFPLGKGYTVDDLQKVSEEMAGSSLQQFFHDYVHGTTPIPWEQFLGYAGLQLETKDADPKPWLGISTYDQDNQTRVYGVVAGSPAYDAGLDVNDEVLAMNGYKVRTNDLTTRVAEMKAGDTVKLTVFRNNVLREFDVTLRNQEVPNYSVTQVDHPTELQQSIYNDWLKTSRGKETK
ncbi:MAG TPA: PDZ domain-containing protein [Bacteroidota bacterium]